MLLKTIAVERQEGHCIRDRTFQVENSILLLKIIIMAKQTEHYIRDEM